MTLYCTYAHSARAHTPWRVLAPQWVTRGTRAAGMCEDGGQEALSLEAGFVTQDTAFDLGFRRSAVGRLTKAEVGRELSNFHIRIEHCSAGLLP